MPLTLHVSELDKNEFLSIFLDQQQAPGEDPNPFTWNRIVILGIIGAVYLFTSSIDPVPETSWSSFQREMLSTGEVSHSSLGPN